MKITISANIKSIGILFLPAAGILMNHPTSEARNNQVKKPNIIFILADDLGIGEVSSYGADNYSTPNIDRLASEGIRFTHAYTAPLCGPSRAMILTGRHLFRTGATNQDATGQMKPSVETFLPVYLKKAGYITSSIGKWGQLPLDPADFGFDEYLKFKGSGKFWNTQTGGESYLVNGKEVKLKDKEYLPDVMHKHVVDFMTRHLNQPFFIYYSMSHVHAQILPTPDSKPDSKDIFNDNITYMDKLVGQLRNDLDRLQLTNNTILIFFSDNGTAQGQNRPERATIGGKRLSGQKGTLLEGGSLEPLVVYWPGVTPVGKVSQDLICSVDFVPTFAEIAGVRLPDDRIFDGQSFNAQLHGKKGTPRTSVFIQLANNYYVRSTGWKLNQSGELFDMSRAPFEEIPVPADTKNREAISALASLRAEINRLNPAEGIRDTGDGTGRSINRLINNNRGVINKIQTRKDKAAKSERKKQKRIPQS